jgi:plasmid stabilization system protein ParE
MAHKKVKEIVWSASAEKQFYEILEYLSEEAPNTIDKVGNAILDTIESLVIDYNKYPIDRFKLRNDNTYKAVLVYSYRISYKVSDKAVNILRIRHTSREPLKF